MSAGLLPDSSYCNPASHRYFLLLFLFFLVGSFLALASKFPMENDSIAGVTYAVEMRHFFKKLRRFLSKPFNSSSRSVEFNWAPLSELSKESFSSFILFFLINILQILKPNIMNHHVISRCLFPLKRLPHFPPHSGKYYPS